MPEKVTDTRSRKVIKFPIPKTGEDPNKTKSIDQQVFELPTCLAPLKTKNPVPKRPGYILNTIRQNLY